MTSDNTQYNHRFLNLSESKAVKLLKRFAEDCFDEYNIGFEFNDKISIGNGLTHSIDDQQYVIIGCADLSYEKKVNDLNFIITGVSIFHESRHCEQNEGFESEKHIITNIISTIGNDEYYLNGWKQMPYEIDAEYNGVMKMWTAVREAFPDQVDLQMLNYINFRTNETAYFIRPVAGGYKSKGQVITAFEQAYNDSIFCKRDPQSRISSYNDEFVKLFEADRGWSSPYYKYFDKFLDASSGSQQDRMLTATVIHLHPDMSDLSKALIGENITFESEFGEPFPETSEQSRKRLGLNESEDKISSHTSIKYCPFDFDEYMQDLSESMEF